MNNQWLIFALRWLGAGACLAGIVTFYRVVVPANPTTVALTFLLLILFMAAKWGLRYAIVTSLVATACYNFFFLPPLYTFTIADPQNLLALVVFLITSVFASRLSDRLRAESYAVRVRQSELEMLYRLSRALLQTEELVQLTTSIPTSVSAATGARSVLFYLLEGDRTYRTGAELSSQLGVAELKELSHATGASSAPAEMESIVPLRTGVKPRGVLVITGISLSVASLEALGGLVSISLDKAHAVSEVTRAEAGKESERLRGMMLDSITHDLRTPLTSIKASVTTLLDSDVPPAVSTELLTVIDEEADRLNRLVAQAVEMAQLDTQEVHMTFAPQDLREIIAASLEENGAILAGREVTVRLSPMLPRVNADAVWVQKLLGNLLDNATKYSSPGQPIFLSAELHGEFVACSVADRGAGIDPMEQSLIFEKFYRARTRSWQATGTGMGLAICRAIAEAHAGTRWVTSQVGQGSVFTFTLPADGRAPEPNAREGSLSESV